MDGLWGQNFDASKDTNLSLRRELIDKFNSIIRSQDKRTAGSGVEHASRWGFSVTSGNAANAQLAADMNTRKVRLQYYPRTFVLTAKV